MQLVHNADWPRPAPALAAPAPDSAEAGTTYALHALARLLGVWKRGEGWKVRYITALIAEEGFPRPLPLLVNGTLSRAIHPRKSRWSAVAVRAWLLAQVPAQAVARVEDAAALEAAAAASQRLDARADRLFGGAA